MTTNERPEAPLPWWRSRLVLFTGACVVLTYLFVQWASEVVGRETGTLDHAVRGWVLAHRPPPLVKVLELVTLFGDPITWGIWAAVLALIVIVAGGRLRVLVIAALPFSLSTGARLLRNWYHVTRPPSSFATEYTYGFPSGHTFGSTVMTIVTCYVLARERRLPRFAWAVAFLVPLAVGISRLYLDVHWASDVIGGWLIGGASAVAVCAVYELALRLARSRSGRVE